VETVATHWFGSYSASKWFEWEKNNRQLGGISRFPSALKATFKGAKAASVQNILLPTCHQLKQRHQLPIAQALSVHEYTIYEDLDLMKHNNLYFLLATNQLTH
jgi:hypothetical protein